MGNKAAAETEKKLEIARRRVEVERLYIAGKTYRDIAQALNVSVGTVATDMKAVIGSWQVLAADELDNFKQTQLQRLQRLLAAVWDVALTGDAKAVASARGIMQDMNTLMGLDQAAKVDHTLRIVWDEPLSAEDEIGIGAEEL